MKEGAERVLCQEERWKYSAVYCRDTVEHKLEPKITGWVSQCNVLCRRT